MLDKLKKINGETFATGIRCRDDLCRNWPVLIYYNDHYKRLKTAAKLLSFNFNLTNEQLKNIITNLIKKNNFQNKQIAIRTNITRGVSKRGLDFDKSHKVGIYIKLNLVCARICAVYT